MNAFKVKQKRIPFRIWRNVFEDAQIYVLPEKANLYGAIIYTWYWMHVKNGNYIIHHTSGDEYDVIVQNHKELSKFVETINMMK